MIRRIIFVSIVLLLYPAACNRPPIFVDDLYIVRVPEDARVGTSLINVTATDADSGINGMLSYRLEASFTDSLSAFAIHPETGEVISNRPLDREVISSYRLTVIVRDGGNAEHRTKVVVHVEDINDNAPAFPTSEYSLSVNEGEKSPVGLKIVDIIAADPDNGVNGTVRYRLLRNPHDLFLIYELTGSVVVKRSIDRESLEQSNLTVLVEAYDRGLPPQSSNAVINIEIVDEPDTPPRFNAISAVSVREDIPSNATIMAVDATTPDTNVIIEYAFEGDRGPFSIDRLSGEIHAVKPLDYEEQTTYYLVVAATGRKLGELYPSVKSIATISIFVTNINDELPRFRKANYNFAVPEEQPANYQIEQVNAYDQDAGLFGLLSYSLTLIDDSPVPEDYPFAVKADSGILVTTYRLDFENKSQDTNYIFKLWAADGGNPSFSAATQIEIIVRDVDEPPVFSTLYYTGYVDENAEPGTSVLGVQAADLDSKSTKIVYKLWVFGNVRNSFGINESSGVIFTQLEIDREQQSVFYLTVQAADESSSNLFTTASVKVRINDFNDNIPSFSKQSYFFPVSESINPGSLIGSVDATDLDFGTNSEIVYLVHNLPSNFLLAANTGAFHVHSSLDYEDIKSYHFHVWAVDQGSPSLSASVDVTIAVTDVNDNSPTFIEVPNETSVLENQPPHEVVFALSVTDRDSGINGRVVDFKIVGDDEARGDFIIDSNGVVSTRTVLDRERLSDYFIIIHATDSGTPPMSAETTVHILVRDIIDSIPYFPELTYDTTISSFTQRGSAIVDVSAISRDDLQNTSIRYEVSDSPLFTIMHNNGTVVCTADLDPNIQHDTSYHMEVRAFVLADQTISNFVKFTIFIKKSTCSPTLPDIPPIIFSHSLLFQANDPFMLTSLKVNSDVASCDISYSVQPNFRGILQYVTVGKLDGTIYASHQLPAGNFTLSAFALSAKLNESVSNTIQLQSNKITSLVISNSVAIFFPNLLASQFVARQLIHLLGILAEIFNCSTTAIEVLGIQDAYESAGTEMLVSIRDQSYSSYLKPWFVAYTIVSNMHILRQKLSPSVLYVGHDSCLNKACFGSAVCSSKIVFTGDFIVHRTSRIIFISNRFQKLQVCTCPPWFMAASFCKTQIDLCASNPCKFGGICTETLNGFKCNCPPFTSGDDCSVVCLEGTCNPCDPNPCKNNGRCIPTRDNGDQQFYCSCPQSNMGPLCEVTKVTLSPSSRVVMPNMFSYSKGILSFHFATTESNALLIHSSGMTPNSQMFALEIENSQLRVIIRTSLLNVIVKKTFSHQMLNDGKWHFVNVSVQYKMMNISVSGCSMSSLLTSNTDGSVIGTCVISLKMDRVLNIGGPLQVGSIDPSIKGSHVTSWRYSGCMDALAVNGKLVDLSSAEIFTAVHLNCLPLVRRECSNSHCKFGSCKNLWNGSRCVCNPQEPCHQKYNQAVQITGDSKFKISVKMAGVNSVSLKLKTIIPTSLVVQLGNNSFLAIRFGTVVWWSEHFKIESSAYISDGHWHTLSLGHQGDQLSLDVDNGRLTTHSTYDGRIDIDSFIFSSTDYFSLFQGCLADLTINGILYTIDPSLSPDMKMGCHPQEECTVNACPPSSLCKILLGEPICQCMSDTEDVDSCQDPCIPNPCHNGGTCLPQDGNFLCQCTMFYGGLLCSDPMCPAYHHYESNGECLPCPCSIAGSAGLCNGTSQCVCKQDIPVYSPGNGGVQCQLCNCHPLGSEHPLCNVKTGQCQCKPHVTGERCDRCADGFSGLTHNGCRHAVSVQGHFALNWHKSYLWDSKLETILFEEIQMALLKFPLTFRITLERILVSRDIANYSVAIYSDYEQAVSRHTAISLLDIVFQNRIIGNFIISNHWFPGNCFDDNPCYPGVQCRLNSYIITCGSCPSGFTGSGFTCSPLHLHGILGNDSDFDSIPDHIDNEPFVFNPDQQQIMLPSIAHCSAEYSYNVTWSLTAAGNIDTKPCPGTHKGLIKRMCSSRGWLEANSRNCFQPEAYELWTLANSTRNGLLQSNGVLNYSFELMFTLVHDKQEILGGDLLVLVDYLTELLSLEVQIATGYESIWTNEIVSNLLEVFDSMWYPWNSNLLTTDLIMKGLEGLNSLSKIIILLSPTNLSPTLSFMTYNFYSAIRDFAVEAHLHSTALGVTLHLPPIVQGNSLAIALLPAIPALLKESDGRVINSPVVVVEVSVDSSDQHPFRVAFPMISAILNSEELDPECVYVSENLTWSRDGCSVVKLTPTHITCECWHLSVFAVTVNPQSLKPRRYQVHTATYLFESVGSIILLLSVIIILWIRVPSDGYFVSISLLLFLLLVWIIFSAGINRMEWGKVPCIVFSILLQICTLSVAVWSFLGLVLTLLFMKESYKKWSQLPYYFCIAGLLIPVFLTGIDFGVLVLVTDNLYQAVGYPSMCLLGSHGPIWALLAPLILVFMCTLVLLTVSWFKYRKSKGGDGAKGIQTARFLLMFFTVVIFLSIMSLALKVISTISTLPTTVYTGLQVASSILDAFLAFTILVFYSKAAYSRKQAEKKANEQLNIRERPEGKVSSLTTGDHKQHQKPISTPVAQSVPISPLSIKDTALSEMKYTATGDNRSWFSFPSPSPLDPLSPGLPRRRLSIPDGDFDEADVEDWEWSSNTSSDSPEPPSIISPNDQFVTVSPDNSSEQTYPIDYLQQLNSMSERENAGNSSWLSSHMSSHTRSSISQPRQDRIDVFARDLPTGLQSGSHSIVSKYISGTVTASSVSASGKSYSLPRLRPQEETSETAESYV